MGHREILIPEVWAGTLESLFYISFQAILLVEVVAGHSWNRRIWNLLALPQCSQKLRKKKQQFTEFLCQVTFGTREDCPYPS